MRISVRELRELQERMHLPSQRACLAKEISGHWHAWDFHEAKNEDVQEKGREPEVRGVAGRERLSGSRMLWKRKSRDRVPPLPKPF